MRAGQQKTKRHARIPVLLPLLTLLVMAAGFFVPSALIGRQRRQLREGITQTEIGTSLDTVADEAASLVSLSPLTEETLLRLSGVTGANDFHFSAYYHNPLPGEITEREAVAQVRAELLKMTELSLVPQWCAETEGAQYNALLGTNIYTVREEDRIDPRHDVWEIFIYTPEMTLTVKLHAESGKIIGLSVSVEDEALEKLYEVTGAPDQEIALAEGGAVPKDVNIAGPGEENGIVTEADAEGNEIYMSVDAEEDAGNGTDGYVYVEIDEENEVLVLYKGNGETETLSMSHVFDYAAYFDHAEQNVEALLGTYLNEYLQISPQMDIAEIEQYDGGGYLILSNGLSVYFNFFVTGGEIHFMFDMY